jgi:hypothetical protein
MEHSTPQTTSMNIPPCKLHRRPAMCCVVSWLAKQYALGSDMLSAQATVRAVQQEEAVAVRRCSHRIYCTNSLLPVRLSDDYLVGSFLHLLISTLQLQCWHIQFAGCCDTGSVLSSLVLLWPELRIFHDKGTYVRTHPLADWHAVCLAPTAFKLVDNLCEWHFILKGQSKFITTSTRNPDWHGLDRMERLQVTTDVYGIMLACFYYLFFFCPFLLRQGYLVGRHS